MANKRLSLQLTFQFQLHSRCSVYLQLRRLRHLLPLLLESHHEESPVSFRKSYPNVHYLEKHWICAWNVTEEILLLNTFTVKFVITEEPQGYSMKILHAEISICRMKWKPSQIHQANIVEEGIILSVWSSGVAWLSVVGIQLRFKLDPQNGVGS